MLYSFFSFLWDLVTFQHDISMTISLGLLLFTVYRMLQGFVYYLIHAGPVSTIVAAFTSPRAAVPAGPGHHAVHHP